MVEVNMGRWGGGVKVNMGSGGGVEVNMGRWGLGLR